MIVKMKSYWYFLFVAYFLYRVISENLNVEESDLNFPPEHAAYYFRNHQNASEACQKSEKCPYKKFLNQKKCWGYEKDCPKSQRYLNPVCNKSSKGWVKSKAEQIETFYKQGDFGYIKERLEEIIELCSGKKKEDSNLECAKYMRFCRGRNILFDFKTLDELPEPMRYREDVIQKEQVGGYCQLNKKLLKAQGQHKSPLQSWYAEFEHFTELNYHLNSKKFCNIIIDKPTFIMKLDATVNMYHHFCDFLNLYATLHLNDTFSTDVYILIWDTVPYFSNFGIVWKAFTKHPLMNLGSFKGKKVCFKDVVFPLLPRMIFGMYYNMPLIPGCQRSGLFRAFAEHLKYKLNIKDKYMDNKIRITLISRSTQYRRILNEDELIASVKSFPDVVIKKVNYNRQMPFIEQMEVSYNTDILVGIHGAGLTHMLFLPEWGAVLEIYNCEDENCYADLARLKGLLYLTWEKPDKIFPEDEGHHPTLGAHAKFTNYSFDVKEFKRLIKKAITHVKQHKAFIHKNNQCQDPKCNKTLPHDEF